MQARRRTRRHLALPAAPATAAATTTGTTAAAGASSAVEEMSAAAPAIRWLEAVVSAAPAGPAPAPAGDAPGSMTLLLPGGARLELTSAAQVPLAAALLRALTPHA